MNCPIKHQLMDTFPPTPASFSAGVAKTLKTLPNNSVRWRFPTRAVAAYAAIACAAVLLLLFNIGLPTGIDNAAAPSSTSRHDPLKQITVSTSKTPPRSSDGWQAAAATSYINWYYKPASGELAFTQDGTTSTMSLKLAEGQAVDPDAFLPSRDGRWVAFTVSSAAGDTVWLVTKDGMKLIVPDDIRWDPSKSVKDQTDRIDFANARMVPYSNQPLASLARDSDGASSGGFMIHATFPDGSNMSMQISVNTKSEDPDYFLSGRTAEIWCLVSKGSGKTVVASQRRTYTVSQAESGGFGIDLYGYQAPIQIQSARFAMFKIAGELAGTPQPGHALVIYQDDPKRTLWELNIESGVMKKITEGCITADWQNSGYWYATVADSAAILTRPLEDVKPVSVQAFFTFGKEVFDKDAGTTRLGIVVDIQNNTGMTMTMTETIPCSLTLKRDGKTIWQKTTGIALKDTSNITLYNGDGIGTGVKAGAYWIPAMQALEFTLQDLRVETKGKYTLEGQIYGDPVKFELVLPYEGFEAWGIDSLKIVE